MKYSRACRLRSDHFKLRQSRYGGSHRRCRGRDQGGRDGGCMLSRGLFRNFSNSAGKRLITADHGNCEQMRNPDGSPNTSHTTYLVHCIYVAKDAAISLPGRHSGRCCADSFVSARLAATEGNDRAQFARASLAESSRFKFRVPATGDSMQNVNAVLGLDSCHIGLRTSISVSFDSTRAPQPTGTSGSRNNRSGSTM